MTKSLCPICFKPLDAEVFDEDGKILIKKTCDEHGEFVNTYWSDDKLYNRVKQFEPTITSVENPSVEKFGDCPNNCGLCEDHETSTVLGLIDVTNSYRDLVQRQLAATNSQFVKVYSLGNTTIVYSETTDKIEIVMENHKRPIRQDEVEFVSKRLIHEDRIYDITVDKSRKIISITCDR